MQAGTEWCALYPTSTSLDDLVSPFRENCKIFIAKLETQGCKVTISATWRPAERAYLMHWCCMIAQAKQDPATVPSMDGVEIEWDLGNPEATIAASAAMMKGYGIVYPAALVSRHTQRRAIDMTITPMPADAVAQGASFGVVKLASDPPHWSDDGH